MPAWLFASLRGYRIAWLPRDLVAGLMLAAIAIPGQLATARLAGMPPETGLYAFAAGVAGLCRLRRQSLHVGRRGFHHRADLRRRAGVDGGRRQRRIMPGWPRCSPSWSASCWSRSACCAPAGWPTLLSIPGDDRLSRRHLGPYHRRRAAGRCSAYPRSRPMLVRLSISSADRARPIPIRSRSALGVLAVTLGAAAISPRIPGALIGLVGAGLAVPCSISRLAA